MSEQKKRDPYLIFSAIFVALCFIQAVVGWLMSPFYFTVASFAVATYLFFKPEVTEKLL